MICWQLVCFLCLNLWRMQVSASPTTTGAVTFNADENSIKRVPGYNLNSPVLNYHSSPQDNSHENPSRNASLLREVGSGFLNFHGKSAKRKPAAIKTTRIRRTPTGFSARGFHEGVFDRDFGHFSPVKRSEMDKRRPESDAAGFYGDTFSNGFGEFETMKRKYKSPAYSYKGLSRLEAMDPRYLPQNVLLQASKRRPEMTKTGFDGDLFNSGFGEFHPMRK